jgi:methylated-DNA-[protein]-cysteine S-methyltransferase
MNWSPHAVQSTMESPWGPIRLCATPSGLAGLWFHNQKHLPPGAVFQEWPVDEGHPVLMDAERQLQAYFAGKLSAFDLPLDLSSGTPFQTQVWQCLLTIPAGATRTYGHIALSLGRAAAVRAVGAAVGRNPVSIIVPCHRVLGANGALTGYAGGLDRKTALLQLEAALGA